MPMTQMNVRIDADLKKAGDEALASIGLTPSETVRMVWQAAAERKEGLDALRNLAVQPSEEHVGIQEDNNGFKHGWEIVDAFMKEWGLDTETPVDISDEELLEQALWERMEERGLAG